MPTIRITTEGIEDVFAGLDKKTIATGAMRGMNKMADRLKTAARKRIRGIYTIPAGRLAQSLRVDRAKRYRLAAYLICTGTAKARKNLSP